MLHNPLNVFQTENTSGFVLKYTMKNKSDWQLEAMIYGEYQNPVILMLCVNMICSKFQAG